MKKFAITLGLSLIAACGVSQSAFAQLMPHVGQVMTTGGSFCPRRTMPMAGQILAISQYADLYAALGTTYGGDGQTTFALPDARGRAIVSSGVGPGLAPGYQGESRASGDAGSGATPTVTLLQCIAVQGFVTPPK